MRIVERVIVGTGFAFILTGCFWFDENKQTFIAGKYYAETSSDTRTALYFDDSQGKIAEPLLKNVSALGVTADYLVVRDEARYYLFARGAATNALASKTSIGPIDSRAFRRKLMQLCGDSTLQLSSKL